MTAPVPPAGPPRPGPVARGGAVEPTSEAPSVIAAAVARLDRVHELPLHEQPDVYQSVHAELQNALAAIDDA